MTEIDKLPQGNHDFSISLPFWFLSILCILASGDYPYFLVSSVMD